MAFKILIVDDEQLLREMLKDIFRIAGYNVITAENGKQGLDKIYSESPDFVVLDASMPVMDGFEVLKKIREDPKFMNLPVMMFTALSGESEQIKGLISSYNYRVSNLEEINEYDWKQLAGDVFRPPRINALLLSSMLGTGSQLLSMFTITLLLGLFGFMNPEKRVNIINIGILLYCFSGIIGGYISSNFYRFWGGISWLRSAIFTSFLFPGTLIFGYIIINIQ